MEQALIRALALTFDFIGTLLIGFAILKVHATVGEEHKIDRHVTQLIRREREITMVGLMLITVGFILHFFA